MLPFAEMQIAEIKGYIIVLYSLEETYIRKFWSLEEKIFLQKLASLS